MGDWLSDTQWFGWPMAIAGFAVIILSLTRSRKTNADHGGIAIGGDSKGSVNIAGDVSGDIVVTQTDTISTSSSKDAKQPSQTLFNRIILGLGAVTGLIGTVNEFLRIISA